MKIILYSTGCPMCRALERQLAKRNLEFELVNCTEDLLIEKGFHSAPGVDIDGELMDFTKAMAWIREH